MCVWKERLQILYSTLYSMLKCVVQELKMLSVKYNAQLIIYTQIC